MTRIVKTLLLVLSFLTVMVVPARSVEVGESMPDFALQTFDGSNLSRAMLEGKPLLLVFWNTWCPNCMRELPRINRLAEEFGPRGLKVLAVNTGINDAEGKARAFWKKHGYGFPTGFDHVFEIGQAFRVRGVPTIFLVDSKGVVRYKNVQLPENMEEHFKQLIRN